MATGYARQDLSDSIANGSVIDATALDGEFNGIEAAFNSTSGHAHDGTSGNGGPILSMGPNQDFIFTGQAIAPRLVAPYNLGTDTHPFNRLFISDKVISDKAEVRAISGGESVSATTIIAASGGTTPRYTFSANPGAGIHYYTTTNNLSLVYDNLPRVDINASAITAVNGAVFTGNVSGLTGINGTNIATGNIPSARVSGTYSLITGVGTLTAGSIGAGFGNISIGASIFSGVGSGLTGLNASQLSTGFVPNDRISGAYDGITTLTTTTSISSYFRASVGTVDNPSFTFNGDLDTGIYNSNTNVLAVTAGGITISTFASSGLRVYSGGLTVDSPGVISGIGSGLTSIPAGQLTGTVDSARMVDTDYNLKFAAGTATDPSMSFGGDPDTGIYNSNTNVLAITTQGTASATFANSGFRVYKGDIVVDSPGTFSGNGSNITAIDASNISTGTLNAARLSTTTVARDWVLDRSSEATLGAVGTYAFLCQAAATTTDIIANTTYAGSGLRYAGFYASGTGTTDSLTETLGGTPSGTWRAMGSVIVNASRIRATLFLRVS